MIGAIVITAVCLILILINYDFVPLFQTIYSLPFVNSNIDLNYFSSTDYQMIFTFSCAILSAIWVKAHELVIYEIKGVPKFFNTTEEFKVFNKERLKNFKFGVFAVFLNNLFVAILFFKSYVIIGFDECLEENDFFNIIVFVLFVIILSGGQLYILVHYFLKFRDCIEGSYRIMKDYCRECHCSFKNILKKRSNTKEDRKLDSITQYNYDRISADVDHLHNEITINTTPHTFYEKEERVISTTTNKIFCIFCGDFKIDNSSSTRIEKSIM